MRKNENPPGCPDPAVPRRNFETSDAGKQAVMRSCRPALTTSGILTWADAHHALHGRYPKKRDGQITGGPPGLNWRMVDNALRIGLRGLAGGSSLPQLLTECRGYRNKQALPPITEDLIANWAQAHHKLLGAWPTEDGGTIIGAPPGEDWNNVNAALVHGHRGLPGGDSLAKLLARCCGARTKPAIPRLTVALVLSWADAHHQAKDEWPRSDSGPVLGHPGETWGAIDAALQKGGRGLKGGSSLARLLTEMRGTRHKGQLPQLTRKGILAWAKSHHERKGEWPTPESGAVEDAPDESWKAVDLALHQGLRGLPGGSSLHALLVHHLGKGGRRTAHVQELNHPAQIGS
jgi:hypothetical protein